VGGQTVSGGTAATRACFRLSAPTGTGLAVEAHITSNQNVVARHDISPVGSEILTIVTTVTPVEQVIGDGGVLDSGEATLIFGTATNAIATNRPVEESLARARVSYLFHLPAGHIWEYQMNQNTGSLGGWFILSPMKLA
jgi:hypothetical protein